MVVATRRRVLRLSATERRALLLSAAVRVCLRRGVQGTQVAHVVREAGVSRGTFYLHFESKRQLLGAVSRELLDRLLPRFPAPPPLASKADLESAIESLHLHALRAALADRPAARLVLAGGAGSEPAAARWLAAHDEAWRRLVFGLLSRARVEGLLRDGVDLPVAVDAVIGSLQRVLRTAVVRRAEPDAASLAASLTRFHVDALARTSRAPS